SLTTVLRHGILPYLAELGDRWANGTASIAQEHFASNLLRGRLAGLARGWGLGSGQRAVLACPPGELHDLTLMVFGIVLARHGWRITYLGMDTPVSDLHSTARAVEADLVVLAATGSSSLDGITAELAELAASVPLLLGGAGATRRIADQVGATLLMGDPISVAEQLGTTTRIGATR
ncbi:MAG: cobalamin B12-binding domain-containing protein, partial [Lapillicoccus sp.]